MQTRKVRRRARKTALQIMYGHEIGNINIDDVVAGKITMPEEITEIDDYCIMLLNGVTKHLDELDKSINDVSTNWDINRMPIVDKCLLRQTVYEMIYCDDVPVSVSINEAVELAKSFGGADDSHKFVNGILGKIAKQIEEYENKKEADKSPRKGKITPE